MTSYFSGLSGHPLQLQAINPAFLGWTRASHLDPLDDEDLVDDSLTAHEIAVEHGLELGNA